MSLLLVLGTEDSELDGDLFSSDDDGGVFVQQERQENPERDRIAQYYKKALGLSNAIQKYCQNVKIPGLKKFGKAVTKEAQHLKTLTDHADGKETDFRDSLLLPTIPNVTTSNLPTTRLFSTLQSEHDVTAVSNVPLERTLNEVVVWK
eukprot:TRINITY_DN1486_c3_g1_i1.p1 TRINITY_DN1486_c3_g1~~TRINITY_DN1486_c3_g1_i1.p1  ORF type:complete len:148 (+),score=33.60 TRINITY_DN1486_c3_g1_i1:602-1045(+)